MIQLRLFIIITAKNLLYSKDGQRVLSNSQIKNHQNFWGFGAFSTQSIPRGVTRYPWPLSSPAFSGGNTSQSSKVRTKKNFEDKNMAVDKALERAFYLEAVKRIKEEEKVPQIAAISHD